MVLGVVLILLASLVLRELIRRKNVVSVVVCLK